MKSSSDQKPWRPKETTGRSQKNRDRGFSSAGVCDHRVWELGSSMDHHRPRKLLFARPTLCDELPIECGGHVDGTELILHKDDWRQIEFVSQIHEALLETEFDPIRTILEKERAGTRFRRLHVRTTIREPLFPQVVSLWELLELTVHNAELRALAFPGAPEKIHHSFAVKMKETAHFYGTSTANLIEVLGLALTSRQTIDRQLLNRLEKFAGEKNLLFVDWCTGSKGVPGEASFAESVVGAHP